MIRLNAFFKVKAGVTTRHARSEHFTRIVPELEKLTDGGLSIEQFER